MRSASACRRRTPSRCRRIWIHHQDWFREDFRALLELLRERKIHPVVAERLPFSEARHAHEMLETTASTGKLVLIPSGGRSGRRDQEARSGSSRVASAGANQFAASG